MAEWEKIAPSSICKAVYNGNEIQNFWKNLFGEKSTKPLIKQTFLRLMGSSGTIEHADYYYFKRDTHIFTGEDGLNAQKASAQYLKNEGLWNSNVHVKFIQKLFFILNVSEQRKKQKTGNWRL